MKPQQFNALAVAAAVSLVAALLAYSAFSQRSSATPSGAKLVPALEQKAASLASIELAQGKSKVTLERKGDNWAIKEKDGFLASNEKVRTFLLALTEADLAEPKTRLESRYPLLELEDPQGENANSHLVRLVDKDGKKVAEIVAGKTRVDAFGGGRPGTYVRIPGDPQAWLASRQVAPSVDIKGWARDRLFETRPEKIKIATITMPGDVAYAIERDTDGRSFKLAKVPAGKKIKFMNAADDIVDTASSFNIDDVRRPDKAAQDATKPARIDLELDSGLKLSIEARKSGDTAWLTFAADGTGDGKAAADDLKALADGWEFKMPVAQYDRMFKNEADLLEDTDPPAQPAAPQQSQPRQSKP